MFTSSQQNKWMTGQVNNILYFLDYKLRFLSCHGSRSTCATYMPTN